MIEESTLNKIFSEILDFLTSAFFTFILLLVVIFYTIKFFKCEMWSDAIYAFTASIILLYTYYTAKQAKATLKTGNKMTAASNLWLRIFLTSLIRLTVSLWS